MRTIFFMILTCLLLSCNSKVETGNYSIDKIEFYYIPFDINIPIQSYESSLRVQKPDNVITNKLIIEDIIEEVGEIQKNKTSESFNEGNVYLIIDFFDKNQKKYSLLYDKRLFRLGEKTYSNVENIDVILNKVNIEENIHNGSD